jgi:hypothetical protein
LDRVTALGVDPLAWLVGKQRGRDDLTEMAVVRPIAIAPSPTGSCFIHQDQGGGLGVPPAHALIKVHRPGANGTEKRHCRVVSVRHVRYGNGFRMHRHADGARARR